MKLSAGASFDYTLPVSSIAQVPISPRDQSKILVASSTGTVVGHFRFSDLPNLLPANAVVVFNDTKVEPARLQLKKVSGGKVEFLVTAQVGAIARGLTNRRLTPGQVLTLGKYRLVFQKQAGGEACFRVPWPEKKLWLIAERFGTTPLPPYLKRSPLSETRRRKEYQSIFAQHAGSSAAPTASLHFTPRLISAMQKQGIEIEYVTLHVGLGTFAPLTEKNLRSGKLHEERYEISPAAAARLNAAKKEGRPIIAIGTTVARALESASRRGRLIPGTRRTTIFIRHGYRWKYVDGLITNFHVPQSSLLMLVASLIGRKKLFSLYQTAIKQGYYFLSFGDGMLILPEKKAKKIRS